MAPRVVLSLAVASLTLLAACSDDEAPTSPSAPAPYRLVAPLENAVVDLPLVAGQPNTILLTVQLPPDIPRVTAAEIDVRGTLDHVRIDGVPLWRLIARKAARAVGKADDIGAMATIRVGSDPATVCESGILYGPFKVSHFTELMVNPETAAADGATLDIINMGAMVVCLTVIPNIDALLSVEAVALDIAEGECAPPGDFAGTWSGKYHCGNSCGEPFGGGIQLVVTQDGTGATHTDSGGDAFAGVICGDMYRFESVGDGFKKRGTMTLTGPGTATKRSTWRSTTPPYCGGDCYDTLTRQIPTAGVR